MSLSHGAAASAASSGVAYKHRRLQHADEIRLVQLLPGRPGSPIQCRLQHIRLLEATRCPYTAISYVWGSQDDLVPVQCSDDGETLWVTQNCHAVLLELRDLPHDGWIWMDAISIDQSRTTERNHQVLLMKRIYSHATKVLIYLGQGPLRISALLRRICHPVAPPLGASSRTRDRYNSQELGSSVVETAWSTSDTEKVIQFLRHPYWRRMWVVQEIYAATHLELLYNGERYDEALVHGIVSIRESLMHSPLWYPLPLTALIREPGSRWRWDLWTLLAFTRSFSTSDIRDRIIALLGIGESIGSPLKELLADYATDTDRLFQRLIMYFFLQVIGMQPWKAFPSIESLRVILDSSSLDVTDFGSPALKHSLRCELADDRILGTHDDPADAVSAVVAVSKGYAQSQLENLWRQCHHFLDIDMPFEDVVQLADLLRHTRSDDSSVGDVEGQEEGRTQSPQCKVAATRDGRLMALGSWRDLQDSQEPLPNQIELTSRWLLRCADPLHHTRTHKTCCCPQQSGWAAGIEWVSSAPKQIGASSIWQSDRMIQGESPMEVAWPAASGAHRNRIARKRSSSALSEQSEESE